MRITPSSKQLLGQPVSICAIVEDGGEVVCRLYTNEAIDDALGCTTLLFGQPSSQLSPKQLDALLSCILAFAKTNKAYDLLLGPLEGSTWHSYRTRVDGDETRYPGEITCHPTLYRALEDAGFDVQDRYFTAINDRATIAEMLAQQPPAKHPDLQLRAVPATEFVQRIAELYPLVSETFARNHLASPISEAAFIEHYRNMSAYVGDGWLQLAALQDEVVGFALLPRTKDVFVCKTLGRLPGQVLRKREINPKSLGISISYLIYQYYLDLHIETFISAQMHEHNPSYKMALSFNSKPVVTYGLYSKQLS